MIDKCKGCQADIFWIETPKGKKMPMDADMVAVRKVKDLLGETGTINWAYISHFSTCPKREIFVCGKK